jgi:hypothetical protein
LKALKNGLRLLAFRQRQKNLEDATKKLANTFACYFSHG